MRPSRLAFVPVVVGLVIFGCGSSDESTAVSPSPDGGPNVPPEGGGSGPDGGDAASPQVICTSGQKRCVDEDTQEVCNAAGTAFENATDCGAKEACSESLGCTSLCALARSSPSTVGCSFFALNFDAIGEDLVDAVVVLNPDAKLSATVKLYASPGGIETPVGSDVVIPPLGSHTFSLPNAAGDVIESVSLLRTGGAFRIESDLPVQAVEHVPLDPTGTKGNGTATLVPEGALGNDYIVAAAPAVSDMPSYLNVVATENGTSVTVTAAAATSAGTGVNALTAGTSQTFTMNRYDTLQVVSTVDVSGALVSATKPVAVFGAAECAQVPTGVAYCDLVIEQMIPTKALGKAYVLAHHPKRSDTEVFRWRLVGAEDGTTLSATPSVAGAPATLDKGQVVEFTTNADATPAGGSIVLTANKRFAAFQYMEGRDAAGSASTGDPLMTTAIPVEQYVKRALVHVPTGYAVSRVQIIRTANVAVTIDGVAVPAGDFYPLGAFSVADVTVTTAAHVIESASPIGIAAYGWTDGAAYGSPAAMSLVPVP